MQTAVYVRISRDRTGEGLGVNRQLEDCRKLANELGWTVAEIYRDNDTSATSGKPRPGYQRMLADIESGRAGAIIAWHPDRLYRQLSDLEELITVVEKHDVEMRTVRYGDFDLATPTGRMIARILGSVATGEVEVKADRWKRAWRQKREAGRPPGGQRLFGYTASGGQLIDDEAEVIRDLAGKVLAGASLNGMAADLNRRGFTTAGGSAWRAHTIRKLLLNPRLAGHSTLKGEIVGPGNWPPILDDPTWQSVRALLSARNRTAAPRIALLAGLAYCGRCGEVLHSGRYTDGTRRLRCLRGPRLPGCGRLTVVAEPVEELVEELVRTRLSLPETRKAIVAAQAGGQTHILAELEAQNRRLEEIVHAIASGAVSAVVGGQAETIVRARVAELDAQLTVVAPARIPEDVWQNWPTDLGERRRLVDIVVARVVVNPAKVKGAPFDPSRVDVEPTDLVTGSGTHAT